MAITDALDGDFKQALKARDEIKLSVLRMLKTAIKKKQVELKRPLEDHEILAVIGTAAKQRRESISQFQAGGRSDLVAREEAELVIVEGYLPTQLSSEEIETLVGELIDELQAGSVKDMGRVMKTFMSRHAGQVEGKVVSAIVKEKLSAL